ncbi:MAG: AMP-binding protein, partial [Planctomycetes bacterium]|nr:AMP-binding protein [Planctomycetota bacterium]
AEPRILFISSEFVEKAGAIKTLLPSIEKIILLTLLEADRPDIPYYENLKSRSSYGGRDRDLDEIALIIYTSGTTGNPKGVMTTFGNLVFQVSSFERLMNLDSHDTFLSILPLNHLLELTEGFLGVLHAGGRICYSKSLHPQEIASIMKERKITYMITVPMFLKMLKGSIEKEIRRMKGINKKLFDVCFGLSQYMPYGVRKVLFRKIYDQFGGKLKGFISGGAPLDPEVGRFFDSVGLPVFQGYGLTETSPVIAVNWPGSNRLGSVGKSIPGAYVRILKQDESQEEGEIITKGPHVMKGYYKRSELTAEVIDDARWFHTGDLGKIDKDGFLYITGRIKNLIVLGGGKKVHPEEVEAVLSESSLIKEVCVLGKKATSGSKEGTEEVAVVVVPADSLRKKEEKAEKIQHEIEEEIDRLSQNLAAYKRPSKIFIHMDDLPKTATRKIKRPLVLEWIKANEEAAVCLPKN